MYNFLGVFLTNKIHTHTHTRVYMYRKKRNKHEEILSFPLPKETPREISAAKTSASKLLFRWTTTLLALMMVATVKGGNDSSGGC